MRETAETEATGAEKEETDSCFDRSMWERRGSGQTAHEVIMRKIVIILCTLDVILMALSVVLYLDEDRTAPVIHMEETQIEYRDGMTDAELLSGVTATDETDGDVTGSLVVEKVSEIGDGTVIVTFGAKDQSNNVVKASRVMQSN